MTINFKSLFLSLVVAALVVFSACKKEDDGPSQAEKDREQIEIYIEQNNLDGQFTSSGLYYVIYESGNSNHPTINSNVTVAYKGYFLSGAVFDENDYTTFLLANLIEGWKEGIPLIGEDGVMTMLVPSELGYNDGVVRAFDIELFKVTN